MCPTIRIDDDVYRWLQSQAVPFEDNPNSVLRRLAGLERVPREKTPATATADAASELGKVRQETTSPGSLGSSRDTTLVTAATRGSNKEQNVGVSRTRRGEPGGGRRPPLARGTELIDRWGIPARQARFHRDGSWYERLEKFPAAYCDREGYVLFGSEDDLRTTPGVRIEPSGQVWVPGGIASLPGYCKTDSPVEEVYGIAPRREPREVYIPGDDDC
jgi:hypothetical protein